MADGATNTVEAPSWRPTPGPPMTYRRRFRGARTLACRVETSSRRLPESSPVPGLDTGRLRLQSRHRHRAFSPGDNSLETRLRLPASAHQSTIREVECSNMRIRHVLALCSLSSLFLIQPGASGQDDSKKKSQPQRETVAKPMSERQKKK